jgi:hypothetical protein
MRRAVVILVALSALVAFAQPAVAKTGPNYDWTQIDNGNWPSGTHGPDCGPCLKWRNYEYDLVWRYALNGREPGVIERISRWAWDSWGALNYPSPVFTQSGTYGCPPGSDACVNAHLIAGGNCGEAFVDRGPVIQNEATITYGYVWLASGKTFSNGVDANYDCNGRYTLLHEVGHVYSEGHSARGWTLMSGTVYNNKEQIDGPAKQEIDAVYNEQTPGFGQPGPTVMAAFQQAKAKAAAQAQALWADLQTTTDEGGTVN